MTVDPAVFVLVLIVACVVAGLSLAIAVLLHWYRVRGDARDFLQVSDDDNREH